MRPRSTRMRDLLREGLAEGAAGYSIGLEYPSEAGSSEEELTALCTGNRTRREVLCDPYARPRRSRRAGGRGSDPHRAQCRSAASGQPPDPALRSCGKPALRRGRRCRRARRGQDIAFDMHTRLYGTTMLSTLLPPWALSEGADGVRAHLFSQESRARIKAYPSLIGSVGNWDNVILLDLPGRADVSRLSLGEIGRASGPRPARLSRSTSWPTRPRHCSGRWCCSRVYDEEMQKVAFAHPLCMPGSDATTLAHRRPALRQDVSRRLYLGGWFWRALVREWKLLKPEEAVHRLTGMPAKILGLSDRGAIRVGARADIAVFCAGRVRRARHDVRAEPAGTRDASCRRQRCDDVERWRTDRCTRRAGAAQTLSLDV